MRWTQWQLDRNQVIWPAVFVHRGQSRALSKAFMSATQPFQASSPHLCKTCSAASERNLPTCNIHCALAMAMATALLSIAGVSCGARSRQASGQDSRRSMTSSPCATSSVQLASHSALCMPALWPSTRPMTLSSIIFCGTGWSPVCWQPSSLCIPMEHSQ